MYALPHLIWPHASQESFCSVLFWENNGLLLSLGTTDYAFTYCGRFMFFIIKLQTDSNVASTSNTAQTKAIDSKKSSNRSAYDDTSVKMVMAGTGCSNVAAVQHVWIAWLTLNIALHVCTWFTLIVNSHYLWMALIILLQVLGEMDGDVDSAIEYMIAERHD